MQSVKKQVSLFSGRFIFFILVIASIFHFGQSSSPDSSSLLIHKKNVLNEHNEIKESTGSKNNNASEATVITGEEYIYIAEGISFYGLDEKSLNKITKRKTSAPQPQKSIAKKENVGKKAITNKPVVHAQLITSLPENNNFQHILLSGQIVCTVPVSHGQIYVFLQNIRYIPTTYDDEYSRRNYHFHFSVLSKNIIDGGGIRPPPAHC